MGIMLRSLVNRRMAAALAPFVLLAAGRTAGAQEIQVTVKLAQIPAKMVIAPPGQSGAPGATVVYQFRVQNISSAVQSYRLTITSKPQSWKTFLPLHPNKRLGPLAAGQIAVVPVKVLIPTKAAVGSTEWTTLTATTVGRPAVTDQDSVITTVVPKSALALTAPSAVYASPGKTVRCRALVTYSGAQPCQVSVTGGSVNGWSVTAGGLGSASVAVPRGGTVEVILELTIPANAPPGGLDLLLVTAEAPGPPPLQSRAAVLVTVR